MNVVDDGLSWWCLTLKTLCADEEATLALELFVVVVVVVDVDEGGGVIDFELFII